MPSKEGKQEGDLSAEASVESTAPQVVGDDDVRDGVEDELDVVGVSGAGDVCVDLLVGRLVLALILRLDVRHCLGEGAGACVLRKADSQWRFLDFLLKYVLLV